MRSQDEQRGFRDVDSILSLDFNDGSGVRYKGFIIFSDCPNVAQVVFGVGDNDSANRICPLIPMEQRGI